MQAEASQECIMQIRAAFYSKSASKSKKFKMNLENTECKDSYQILVCNIHWDISTANRRTVISELPEQLALDVPENVLNQAKKKSNDFNDVIEQFAYNLLTRKFNCEVCYCQIWLPLE